jgi:two-component system chemotaxis response regulator CheY
VTKILIVDDSPSMREHVKSALVPAGFEVVEAADGLDALDVIRTHLDIELVILDLNMPRMDGLSLLDAMRNAGRSIKTVMLTTEAQTTLIERGKRAGAKGWLVKPFKHEHLVAVARRLTVGATLTETGTTFVVPRGSTS